MNSSEGDNHDNQIKTNILNWKISKQKICTYSKSQKWLEIEQNGQNFGILWMVNDDRITFLNILKISRDFPQNFEFKKNKNIWTYLSNG